MRVTIVGAIVLVARAGFTEQIQAAVNTRVFSHAYSRRGPILSVGTMDVEYISSLLEHGFPAPSRILTGSLMHKEGKQVASGAVQGRRARAQTYRALSSWFGARRNAGRR